MRLLYAALVLAIASNAAAQQTLTVLSSNATNTLIHELHPAFEKATGWTLRVKFDNSAALKTRIENGEAFDVAVMTSTLIGDLSIKPLRADGLNRHLEFPRIVVGFGCPAPLHQDQSLMPGTSLRSVRRLQ